MPLRLSPGIGGSVDAALNNPRVPALQGEAHEPAASLLGYRRFGGTVYLTRNESWTIGYRTVGIAQLRLVVLLFITLPLWRNSGKNAYTAKPRPLRSAPDAPKSGALFRIMGVKQALAAFFCYSAIDVVSGLWGSAYPALMRACGRRSRRSGWLCATSGYLRDGLFPAF